MGSIVNFEPKPTQPPLHQFFTKKRERDVFNVAFYGLFLTVNNIAAPMITNTTIIAIPVPKTYESVIDAGGATVGANVGCGSATVKVVSEFDGQ